MRSTPATATLGGGAVAEPEATAAALERAFLPRRAGQRLARHAGGAGGRRGDADEGRRSRRRAGVVGARRGPVVKAKNEGSRLFAAYDLEAAEAAYSAGLRAEGAAGHAERGRLLINRAFARLKLASAEEHGVKKRRKLYNDCVNDCYDALHLQPDSTKALYRRARALLGLACAPLGVAGSTEQAEALAQAKEDLARVVRLDPANRDAAQWLEAAPLLVRRVDGGRRKLPAATDGLAAFRRAASITAVVAADAADASSAALTWVYDNRGPVLTAAVILLLALLLPMAYSAVANLIRAAAAAARADAAAAAAVAARRRQGSGEGLAVGREGPRREGGDRVAKRIQQARQEVTMRRPSILSRSVLEVDVVSTT